MKQPRYKLLAKWEKNIETLEERERKQANSLARTQLKITELNDKIREEYKRVNINL